MNEIEKSRISKMRELHNRIESGIKTTLEMALELGRMLVDVKSELNHGEFLPWIATNMNFAERTARYYMTMHHKRGILKSATVADLAGAYKLLAPSKSKIKYHPDCEQMFMDIKDIEPNPFFKMSRLIGEEVEHWVNVIEHYQKLHKGGAWEYPIPYWGTVVRFTGKEYQNVCEHERFFAMKQLKLKDLWVCILEGERMLSDKRMKEVLETFDYPRFYKYRDWMLRYGQDAKETEEEYNRKHKKERQVTL